MRFLISSVRRQLLAAFMGVSAIFLVAVALGWTGIGAVDAKVQSAAKEQQVLEQASGSARDLAASELATVINPKKQQDHEADVAAFQKTIAALKGYATSQAAQDAVGSLNSAFTRWQSVDQQVLSTLQEATLPTPCRLAAGPADQAVDQLTTAVAGVSTAVSDDNAAAASSRASNGRTVMLILAALALLIAAIISFSISRDVSVRVKRLLDGIVDLDAHCLAELEEGLEAIARGDLTREVTPRVSEIPSTRQDEIGQLTTTFNAMVEKTEASDRRLQHDPRPRRGDAARDQRRARSSSRRLAADGDHLGGDRPRDRRDRPGRRRGRAGRRAPGRALVEAARADRARSPPPRNASAPRRAGDRRAPPTRPARSPRRAPTPSRGDRRDGRRSRGVRPRRPARSARSARSPSGSAGSSTRSPASPSRPTCWRSTPRSRPPAPASRAAASRSSPRRSASSPRSRSGRRLDRRADRRDPARDGARSTVVEGGAERTEDGAATVEQARASFERIGERGRGHARRVEQIATAIEQIASAG